MNYATTLKTAKAEKRVVAAAMKWWLTVRNPWKNPHGVPGCKAFGYFKRACAQLDRARR